METESKYLKKIRDEIEKKSGKAKEHTGPNTVANYLNDIAKGVKDLDVGGGGGGIIEGPFSFTNETTDTSGTYNATVKAEVTDKKILYSSVEKDKTTGDIKNSYSVSMRAPTPTNPHAGVEFNTVDSRFGSERYTGIFDGEISVKREKDNVEKSVTVNYDDITTGDSNTWDGTHDSLKEALAMIPKVHTVSTGNSISIRSHDEAGLQFPLDFVDDIEKIISWSIVTGDKNGGSSVVEYTAANIHGPVLVQPAVEGDPVMFNVDLVNDTDSLVEFDVVKVIIVTVG